MKMILFWLVFLGFVGLVVWTLLFSPVMKVTAIEVKTQRVNAQELEQRTLEILNNQYLNLIPKNNLLLMPKKEIASTLQSNDISIRNVTVSRKFPNIILIEVDERESHIIWCSQGKCYLVDERAEIFYEIKGQELEEAKKEIVTVFDNSQKEIIINSRVTSPELIQLYEKLPRVLEDQARVKVETSFSTASSMSEEVRVKTVDGWGIYLSTSRPIENQAEVLRKILDEKIPEEQRGHLEYIDLRIKGKGIFKYKEGSETSEEGKENKEIDAEEDV